MTISKSYRNVFEVLGNDAAVAQNLKIRAELMNKLRKYIAERDFDSCLAITAFGLHRKIGHATTFIVSPEMFEHASLDFYDLQ